LCRRSFAVGRVWPVVGVVLKDGLGSVVCDFFRREYQNWADVDDRTFVDQLRGEDAAAFGGVGDEQEATCTSYSDRLVRVVLEIRVGGAVHGCSQSAILLLELEISKQGTQETKRNSFSRDVRQHCGIACRISSVSQENFL